MLALAAHTHTQAQTHTRTHTQTGVLFGSTGSPTISSLKSGFEFGCGVVGLRVWVVGLHTDTRQAHTQREVLVWNAAIVLVWNGAIGSGRYSSQRAFGCNRYWYRRGVGDHKRSEVLD